MHSSRLLFSSVQTQQGWIIVSVAGKNDRTSNIANLVLLNGLVLCLDVGGEVVRLHRA